MHYQSVLEFNRVSGAFVSASVNSRLFDEHPAVVKLKVDLIAEEVNELVAAWEQKNWIELIDALADIEYVVWGAGQAFGLCPEASQARSLIQQGDSFQQCIAVFPLAVAQLRQAVLDRDIEAVSVTLDTLLTDLYKTARKGGIDLNHAFELVHISNMTKFPETEAIAQETVKAYAVKGISVGYRQAALPGRFVVYNMATNKVLKSILYAPVNLTGVQHDLPQ